MCIIPTDFKLSNREECLVVNSKEINVMKLVKVVFVGFGRLGLRIALGREVGLTYWERRRGD